MFRPNRTTRLRERLAIGLHCHRLNIVVADLAAEEGIEIEASHILPGGQPYSPYLCNPSSLGD